MLRLCFARSNNRLVPTIDVSALIVGTLTFIAAFVVVGVVVVVAADLHHRPAFTVALANTHLSAI